MRRSLWIVCLAAACLVSIRAIAARAVEFVASGFRELCRSASAFVWAAIEPALRSSAQLAYVGPSSIHALRHEAGTSRRAAERHI
jgi:hypothetical protein